MTGMLLYIKSIGLVNRSFVLSGEFLFFPRWRAGTKLQRSTCNLLFGMTYFSKCFFRHIHSLSNHPFSFHKDICTVFLELLVSHKPKLTPWIPPTKNHSHCLDVFNKMLLSSFPRGHFTSSMWLARTKKPTPLTWSIKSWWVDDGNLIKIL